MKLFKILWLLPVTCFAEPDILPNCLYISSYHAGYEWNDGIERGIHSVLDNKCQISKFYMDTKRNKDISQIKQSAHIAKQYISEHNPDIIIACDDNAAKYLIAPYYKNNPKPFVFCGINWTVEPYGFPYSNVTGMVEISPIKPLIKEIESIVKFARNGIYIGPDVISQHKEFELNRKLYKKQGITLTAIFVKSMQEWEQAYSTAQSTDFIIIGNNGGISSWNNQRAADYAFKHARTLTVTNYEWMTQYAMLAMTKVSEEQGIWAGEVALSILEGEKPANIPIIANREKHIYTNPRLLKKAKIKLPPGLIHRSKKVNM